MRVTCPALAIGLAVFLAPGAVTAQGRGNGRPKQPRIVAQAAAPAPSDVASVSAARSPAVIPQFGSWLDDASTPAAGTGYTGIGVGYWRGSGVSQIDAPIFSLTYGVSNRAQLAAHVPFYRISYQGTTARGLDDVYISGKIAVVDPTVDARHFGLAVGSVVEILSAETADLSRVHWALPVSLEFRGDAVRAYGSAGYFSRGAFFTAGAIEWRAPSRTTVTGALAHAISLASVTSDATARPRENLVDVTLFVAHPLADTVAAYAAAGQTFTSVGDEGTLTLSGGVSFRFSLVRP